MGLGESSATKFRAIDSFTREHPNTPIKKWQYVDPSNTDIITIFTGTETLTVQYNPEMKKSMIIALADNEPTGFQSGERKGLRCPQCGAYNVGVQMVSESQLENKHKGCIWWLLVAWWWLPIKWIFFTLPALIFKIFVPKRQKITTEHIAMCVCQSCGHTWRK